MKEKSLSVPSQDSPRESQLHPMSPVASYNKHRFPYGKETYKFALSPPYERNELYENPNATFPVLVADKISKLSAKFKKRDHSPDQQETMESLTEEIFEENENDEDKKIFKRLPIFSDREEFGSRNTQSRGRKDFYEGSLNRCKSVDLPLDKVQEDQNEEEHHKESERHKRMTLSPFHDMNEFNREKNKRRSSFGFSTESKFKKFSSSPKETIVEEREKRVGPSLQSYLLFSGPNNPSSTNSSFNGSYHGSHHSSPRFKLKVDEVDLKEKDKKIEGDEETGYDDIEMILEEAEDKHVEHPENREFHNALQKLQEEKEFMKKVIKGDIIGESEGTLTNLNTGEKEYLFMNNEPIQEEIEEEGRGQSNKVLNLSENKI